MLRAHAYFLCRYAVMNLLLQMSRSYAAASTGRGSAQGKGSVFLIINFTYVVTVSSSAILT